MTVVMTLTKFMNLKYIFCIKLHITCYHSDCTHKKKDTVSKEIAMSEYVSYAFIHSDNIS